LYEDLRAAAVCRGATSRESEELARRLVAAWNACDGIETAHLEELGLMAVRMESQLVGHLKSEVAALKAQRDDLVEALAWLEQFNPREGEGANERFERLGDAFYKDTGHLRPGKDASMDCGISEEERVAIWQKWLDDGRNAASSLLAKHKGSV